MGIWDSVITEHDSKPPFITIHGQPGTGKTTLACQAPKPFVFAVEDGLGRSDKLRSIPSLKNFATYDQLRTSMWEFINDPRDRKTMVVDSLDRVEDLINSEICRREGVKTIGDIGYGKGPIMALSLWHEFLDLVHRAQAKGLMVILIAHSHAAKFDPPDAPAYQLWDLKIHSKASALIREESEAIFYAMIPFVLSSTDGAMGSKSTKATAVGARRLYMQPGGGYVAKSRFPTPEWMELPIEGGWEQVAKYLTGVPA